MLSLISRPFHVLELENVTIKYKIQCSGFNGMGIKLLEDCQNLGWTYVFVGLPLLRLNRGSENIFGTDPIGRDPWLRSGPVICDLRRIKSNLAVPDTKTQEHEIRVGQSPVRWNSGLM